jgi:toxin ParE1/3/4
MITKHRRAVLSIIEQAEWFADYSEETAFRFIEATEKAFNDLEKNPDMGRVYNNISDKLSGIRVWRVPKFESILIFYRPLVNGVEIIDLMHSARDLNSLLDDIF